MGDGIAILIAIGAVAAVLYVTRKQEAATAMRASNIQSAKAGAVLTGGDSAVIIGTAFATYFGGPKAGAAVLQGTGTRL